MNIRIQRKRQTRQKLVNAATDLFAANGVGCTKTMDVARKAGLSHGGLFVHFPTRADLLAEVVSEIGRHVTDRLHAQVSAEASVEQVLQAHIACLSEFEDAYTAFLCETRELPHDVLRVWVGVQSAIASYLAQAADREAESGLLKPMPAHLLFNTWIGLVHHYLMNRALFIQQGSVLARFGPEMIEHFLLLVRATDSYRKNDG